MVENGAGYRDYSFIFWPLVALMILSPARDINTQDIWRGTNSSEPAAVGGLRRPYWPASGPFGLARNLLDRRVARIVPLTPGFQVSNYAGLVILRLE